MNSRLSFVKSLQTYQDENGELTIDADISSAVNEADRVYIVACGTSYHAGLVGKQYIENGENSSRSPCRKRIRLTICRLLSKKPLFIFISQSGETADSRAVLVKVKELGHKALTITNVAGSTISP